MNDPIADKLILDRQLCFRLYTASRAIQRRYRPALDELGITYPQYLVLLALWQWDVESPDTVYTIKALGTRLSLDSGTMTPLIKRMVASGWIQKTVGQDDARASAIQLAPKGRALRKRPKSCLTALPVYRK